MPRVAPFVARFLLLLAVVSATHAAAQTVRYETLLLAGDPAPGGPPGAVLDELAAPGIPIPLQNSRRDLAVVARLADGVGGITSADDLALWGPNGPGALVPLLREGTQAPGFGPGTILATQVFGLGLNEAGQVLVDWRLAIGSGGVSAANDQVKWLSDGQGGVSIVARTGEVAPGTSEVFESLSIAALADTGRVAFRGILDTVNSVDDEALFATDAQGSLELLLRQGAPAPDPTTATMGVIVAPSIGSQGRIGFRGFLEVGLGGVTQNDNDGLWLEEAAGGFALVARAGDPVPGAPGELYLGFSDPFLNASGQAAVRATLQSGEIAIMGPDGFGGLSAVAATGEPAPGVPGAVFGFLNDLALSDTGAVAFRGTMMSGPGGVTFDNDNGVWGPDGKGGVELRIRQSDSLPGSMGLLVVDSISTDPTMNSADDLAVVGRFLVGTGGVDATNRAALLLSRRGGELVIIARTGDAIEVAPGDFRTLTDFAACCNPAEGTGRFIFGAEFSDGSSGIIAADLAVSVPLFPLRWLLGR